MKGLFKSSAHLLLGCMQQILTQKYLYENRLLSQSKIKRSMNNIIYIEACTDCKSHSHKLKHPPLQHLQNAHLLSSLLTSAFPHIPVKINLPPHDLQIISHGLYYNQKQQQIVRFPRINAFEISFGSIMLFSKLSLGRFPKPEEIIFVLSKKLKLSSKISLIRSQSAKKSYPDFTFPIEEIQKSGSNKALEKIVRKTKTCEMKHNKDELQGFTILNCQAEFETEETYPFNALTIFLKSVSMDHSQSQPFEPSMKWGNKLFVQVGSTPMEIKILLKERARSKSRFRALMNSQHLIREAWIKVPLYSRTSLAGSFSFRVLKQDHNPRQIGTFLSAKIEYYKLIFYFTKKPVHDCYFIRISLGHYSAETESIPAVEDRCQWEQVISIVTDCRKVEHARVELFGQTKFRGEKLGSVGIGKQEQGNKMMQFVNFLCSKIGSLNMSISIHAN